MLTMPPTSKMFKGHIGFGLSMHVCVHPLLLKLHCVVGSTEYGALWGDFVLWVARHWNEHFCWKGGAPKDVSTILSKPGHVYKSNFRLAVDCNPHWLPSLDKICKHPIFSGSERYPIGLIYTHLIINYPGHAQLFWTDSLVIFVGCIPQRSTYPTRQGWNLHPTAKTVGCNS